MKPEEVYAVSSPGGFAQSRGEEITPNWSLWDVTCQSFTASTRLSIRANDLRIDPRPQKHTVSATVPMPTDVGYQKFGAAITNGSKPTASAGGICTLNARRIAIEQSTAIITPTTLDLNRWDAMTPTDAVRTHTRGNRAGHAIQPGISGWPKSSYAITMRGGKRMKRRPVSCAGIPRTSTNVSRVTTQKRSWG
ncbi:MAG: hypothetical protein JWQ42_238 [Edaphobacter sp.]|nr:hypothetical protein [Edaphobacter sp.]